MRSESQAELYQATTTNGPYCAGTRSFVSSVIGSTKTCATNMRSKGSLCTGGSAPTFAACRPLIVRKVNPVGSMASKTSFGSAFRLPNADLMLISQIEAALAYGEVWHRGSSALQKIDAGVAMTDSP